MKIDFKKDLKIVKVVAKSGSNAGNVIEFVASQHPFFDIKGNIAFNPLMIAAAKQLGCPVEDYTERG